MNIQKERKRVRKSCWLWIVVGWAQETTRGDKIWSALLSQHTHAYAHTHTHMHTHTHTSGEKKSLWERKAPLSTRLSKLRAGLPLPLCPQASVREWVPSSLEKPTHSSLLLPRATDLTDIGWGLKPGAWDTLLQCLHLDKHLKATKYKHNMRD